MRIRKRQVPFPLLPVTHSDPNLINRSPVMVQLNDATTTSLHPSCTFGSAAAPSLLLDSSKPSDQPLFPIGKLTNGSDESSGEGETHNLRQQRMKQGASLIEDERREEEEGGGHKGNDTRKGRISWSETVSPSSPPKQDGRWSEGDKAFPPKKRRGTFESATEDNSNDEEENDGDEDDDYKKSSKMKMKRTKTKMNRKCSRRGDSNNEGGEEKHDGEYEEEVITRETKGEVHAGKKRVRGGALMEGSRCSRVNGRGWRCCQQTLVGYSLCEHHLGKGRLRSMTSVRNKSIGTTSAAPKSNTTKSEPSSFSEDPLGKDAENVDEKKPVIVTKRRMKLGMVKARSISSLLGQSNTEIVAIAEDSDNK